MVDHDLPHWASYPIPGHKQLYQNIFKIFITQNFNKRNAFLVFGKQHSLCWELLCFPFAKLLKHVAAVLIPPHPNTPIIREMKVAYAQQKVIRFCHEVLGNTMIPDRYCRSSFMTSPAPHKNIATLQMCCGNIPKWQYLPHLSH
jgi:hypothetical protein